MPPIDTDDEIEDMEPVSSEGSDLDEAAKLSPAGSAAASSTATDETEGDDLLSVVREVVNKKQAQPEAASSAELREDGANGAGPTNAEPDNENFSDVPFHTHPRFQQLLREHKASRSDAAAFRNIRSYLDQSGMSDQEVADLLHVGSLMKRDPAEAWRVMQPQVQKLLLAAGEVLPADIRQRVEAGEMSHEAAVELSRERARNVSSQTLRTFEQEQREREGQRQNEAAVISSVRNWEDQRREKDPNFGAKFPAMQREIAFLQATEGRPSTPEGVRQQLEKAYAAVNANLPPVAADPRRGRPAPPASAGQVAGNARPALKSTRDVLDSVLAKHGAR